MSSARAFTSSSAFSIAPIACWTAPPDACRRSAYISATCASYARASFPISAGASRSMIVVTPEPPNDSLYSLHPTTPPSVVIFRKS
jgi:hypothetical protein